MDLHDLLEWLLIFSLIAAFDNIVQTGRMHPSIPSTQLDRWESMLSDPGAHFVPVSLALLAELLWWLLLDNWSSRRSVISWSGLPAISFSCTNSSWMHNILKTFINYVSTLQCITLIYHEHHVHLSRYIFEHLNFNANIKTKIIFESFRIKFDFKQN